ncbi:hypothetical protein QBC43DRAFT_324718 [Cladorrhinum sp. PSN259]|nr:hypothetical protein QBC43DRAFT_324718 [Cladorrhinum sp. PSN259]
MPPTQGLVHPKEYDIKDSNIELLSSSLDHKVKYASAATEPAWNNNRVGVQPGLHIWRIENFCVVPAPQPSYGGSFYDGDSYIILHSVHPPVQKAGDPPSKKLIHDIFFWLGAQTSQDEAGTAAYKTVELDSFLNGAATQHRELQDNPSDMFLGLFPRMTILRGGVASGFRHVGKKEKEEVTTLLRVFKRPTTSSIAGGRSADSVIVYEVEPTWQSLDEGDVFILDKGDKIWVWQGAKCSPMEKAKAAQVVHDMKLAKRVDVEVLSQTESRAGLVVKMLGGEGGGEKNEFKSRRPLRGTSPERIEREKSKARRLFRLSDASGQLKFDLVKDSGKGGISRGDFDGNDVFLLDDAGKTIWVWEGNGASSVEKASWLKVAQVYVRKLQTEEGSSEAYLTPIAKVHEGNESPAFLRAVEVV